MRVGRLAAFLLCGACGARTDPSAADEAGRVETTEGVVRAVRAHDPEAAVAPLARIVEAFDGRGVDREGREIDARVLGSAVVEEAAGEARRRVEGDAPDLARARAALAAGERAAGLVSADEETRTALSRARAYVDLLATPPLDPAVLFPGLSRTDGARVVAFADHFQLGEPILPSVLSRWSKETRVDLVGILAGRVRVGVRRVRAEVAEETAALRSRATELGLPLAGFVGEGADAPVPRWLESVPALVVVLDRDGKIVGRAAGAGVDPRRLDAVIR
jgi:hypothetical protein